MSLLRTVLQPGGRRPWSAVAAVGIQPPLPRRAALLSLPPTPQCKRAARYAVGTGALCTPRRWSSSEAPKQRCGLYAGTFDPPSTGHLDIIRRALQLGDQLIVAVGTNLAKKPIFSVQERVELLQNMVAAEISNRVQDVTIADFLVRGLRAYSDFEYEFRMALINRKLSGIETCFLMADEAHSHVSSSLIRELARWKMTLPDFVPDSISGTVYAKMGVPYDAERHAYGARASASEAEHAKLVEELAVRKAPASGAPRASGVEKP